MRNELAFVIPGDTDSQICCDAYSSKEDVSRHRLGETGTKSRKPSNSCGCRPNDFVNIGLLTLHAITRAGNTRQEAPDYLKWKQCQGYSASQHQECCFEQEQLFFQGK